MSQLLHLGQNQWITVDNTFVDGGQSPRYALVGGQTVQITSGIPPKPTVFQTGKSFFYTNGQPVDREEDVAHLPEPYKTYALQFIHKDEKVPIKIVTTKPSVKGRGRPKKNTSTKIEIKDEASLLELQES